MTTTTLTRIRRTIVAALAAATVAAPSALADPWARDQHQRRANAQAVVVRDGWFSKLPELAANDGTRSSPQHDERFAPVSTVGVRDGWFSKLPELAQGSNTRSSQQHDERFAPVSAAGPIVQHDERFAPVSAAGPIVQHDERFAPVRVSASQLGSTGDGSQIDWGDLATGAGIGIGATLLLGFAALGLRGRRLAHS